MLAALFLSAWLPVSLRAESIDLPFDMPIDLRDAPSVDLKDTAVPSDMPKSRRSASDVETPDAAKPPAAPPSADSDRALPEPSGTQRKAGWVKMPSSLLLYDSSGDLIQEVGIGHWREEGAGARRHIGRGGISSDGRFAWAWEKVDKTRVLRYLGTDGQELWRDEQADAPPDVNPAVPDENGETALVVERIPDGWTVAAYSYMGDRLVEAHEAGVVELAVLSPAGKFALVRWHPENQAPVYTHLNIEVKVTRRVALSNVPPAPPLRIDDEGTVWAGSRSLYPPPNAPSIPVPPSPR